MRKSVLHDFYVGNVAPWEQRSYVDPKAREIIRKADDEEKHLVSRLSPEDVEHLQEFKKLMHHIMTIDEVEVFKIGYKLGALMVMEVLEEKGVAKNG
ncbi:MAG: hypothetical protein K2H52_18200 [Lachnospiraceae bacterium]|nr:hypothetical protein [Lachnospiraceae bacterium]